MGKPPQIPAATQYPDYKHILFVLVAWHITKPILLPLPAQPCARVSWSFSIPAMTSGLVSAASPHARRISATDPVPMQEHIDFRRLHTQS